MKILFVLIFSFSAIAQDCQDTFQRYGSGDLNNFISEDCIQEVLEGASDKKKVILSGKTYVAGQNAILILDENQKLLKTIAGEYTSLNGIINISVNEANSEVAILEDITFEVKTFSTQYAGNIAPLRVLRTNELIGTSHIAYVGDKICAYNPIQKTNYHYSKDANVNRREQFQNLDLLAQVDNANGVSCDP